VYSYITRHQIFVLVVIFWYSLLNHWEKSNTAWRVELASYRNFVALPKGIKPLMMQQPRLSHRSTQNQDALSTSEVGDGAETKKAGIAKVEADVEDEVIDRTKKASGKKRATCMWIEGS
jgi:hypothetical protein